MTVHEVVALVRNYGDLYESPGMLRLADQIEKHGIAPPDGRTPVAWAIDTPHGRGYSFAEELLDSYPVPDGMVLVRKEPVAWRHWHPIELCFEYHLQPVCDRCDALYIAAAPEVKPVHNYLKQADEETHRRVDEAVRDGRIVDKRAPEVKP